VGPGHSAMIGPGQADVVLGLEPVETWRALGRMNAATHVLMNAGAIVPATLTQRGLGYPPLEEIQERIHAVSSHLVTLEGSRLAREAGIGLATNVLLLGALAALDLLPWEGARLFEAVCARSPQRFRKDNELAYALGIKAMRARSQPPGRLAGGRR